MIFYMNTHTFLNLFLENEEDWTILDTYYLMVSHRIHVGTKCTNHMILRGGEGLMPDREVLWIQDPKDQRKQYWHQLEHYKPVFASLIYESIVDGYNTVLLSSTGEMSPTAIPHMDWIEKYIAKEFMYPIYNYRKFVKGKCPIYDYDADGIKKYCKHIIKEQAKAEELAAQQPEVKRSKLPDLPKKELRKELEKYGIPADKSYSRSDMISMLRKII